MIHYIKQNVADIDRGIVAHGCNCRGVQGSGVAKALRDKYPQIFFKYKELCDLHEQSPAALLGTVDFVEINSNLIIANCFTQENYGKTGGPYATIEAVGHSVYHAMSKAEELDLPFYAPKIGCGLGGLDCNEVKDLLEELSERFAIHAYVCDL